MSAPSSWAEGLPARLQDWPVERLCLIHLLRAALGTEIRPDLREQCGTIVIPDLLQEIRRHRVGAYLAHRLPPDLVSLFRPRLGVGLNRIAEQTQLNALRQTAGMIRLTELFSKEGVQMMTLKGPLLAKELYGGQGIRHAGDIDFSIRQGDIQKVDELLRANDYRRSHPPGELSAFRWKKYAEVWRDSEYRNPVAKSSVEVMWRLANNDALQACVSHDEAEDHVLGGQTLRFLPPDVHGVYLLVHGASHGWFRLFWLVDIALLMGSDKANWQRMWELAEETGVDRHFWQGLQLAHELFGVPWPKALMDAPDTRVLRRNIEDAYWQIELSLQEFKYGASHYRMSLYARRLMPDWRIRWRELSKRWISPENWRQMPLSDRWFALYYVVWPFLWAWRQVAKRVQKRTPAAVTSKTD